MQIRNLVLASWRADEGHMKNDVELSTETGPARIQPRYFAGSALLLPSKWIPYAVIIPPCCPGGLPHPRIHPTFVFHLPARVRNTRTAQRAKVSQSCKANAGRIRRLRCNNATCRTDYYLNHRDVGTRLPRTSRIPRLVGLSQDARAIQSQITMAACRSNCILSLPAKHFSISPSRTTVLSFLGLSAHPPGTSSCIGP